MKRSILCNALPRLALLLVLISLIVFHVWPKHSSGFCVGIASKTCACSSDPLIVLRVSANGELALNQNPVGKNALVSLLTNMYATRNECVLYLWGDPGASYQDVIDAIDEVSEIKRPSPRLNLPVIDGVQVPETNLSKIDVRFVTPGALTVCEEGCYSLE